MKRDIYPAIAFHYDSPTKGNEAIAKRTNFKFSALLNERVNTVFKADRSNQIRPAELDDV